MAEAVGIRSAFGLAEETVYGTPVTVSRFVEFLPGESMERQQEFVLSQGIRGGVRNARPGAKRVATTRDAGGSISFEVATKQMGLFFKHLMGGVVTTTGAGPFTHTFPMGTITDRSLTLQKQLRDSANAAVATYTYPGSVITAGEFSIEQGSGILQLALDIDARDEDSTIAAAAASYVSANLFTFAQGTLLIAGVAPSCVHTANVRVENPFKLDRYCLGTAGLKARPTDSDYPAISGSLTADFDASTLYDLFKNNTAATLSLAFVSGADTLTISIPEIRLEGETPKVDSTDIIVGSYSFVGLANAASAAAMSIVYVTSEAAP